MVRELMLVVVLGGLALGCRTENFECGSDNACRIESIQGTCEPSGYCSFPDEECSSGRRYGENAPTEIAGVCVGGESGASTGVTPMTTTSLTGTTGSASTTTATTTDPVGTTLAETGSTGTDASSGTSSEPIEANFVFISSEAVALSPTFINDADALCNTLAGDEGLPGTYVDDEYLRTGPSLGCPRLGPAGRSTLRRPGG